MEITPSLIYWVGVVNSVKWIASNIAMVSAVGAVLLAIITFTGIMFDEFDTDKAKKVFRTLRGLCVLSASVAVVFSVGEVFIPNQKTLAAMLIIPPIVNSEFVQEELPSELRELYGLAKEYVKDSVATSKGGEE